MKKLIKSKKGLTLVELIAAMAISVIVVGATCTVFFVGMRSAGGGNAAYANHGDAYLLERQLQDSLYKANKASISPITGDADHDVLVVHFNSDKDFIVKKNGTLNMTVSGIENLTLNTKSAGTRKEMDYVIKAVSGKNSYTLSGGIVMNNIKNCDEISKTIGNTDTATCLYIEVSK